MIEKTINTDIIKDYMLKNNLSISFFCKKCKISYATYKKIMNNQINFRIIALFRISKVLNVYICNLFLK